MAPEPPRRAPRIHIEDALAGASMVEITGERARYLARVLRARPGDTVILFDGGGADCLATVSAVRKERVRLEIGAMLESRPESRLRIQLVQGISRGERMDLVIQKATELGVHRISPVTTDFGVVRLDAERSGRRMQHWLGVARSACEQCGRSRLPGIDAPVGFRDWIGANPPGAATRIVLHAEADRGFGDVQAGSETVQILIGPEGGLSGAELDLALDSGFVAVRAGPRIMRTETAAIAAMAILQNRFGDLA